MPTLLSATLRHPDAALNHLRAYGQLASAELTLAAQIWQRRLLLSVGAIVSGGLAIGFLGLLLMAWALVHGALGPVWSPLQWVLLSTPAALSGATCLACVLALRATPSPAPLRHLQRQWQLDATWLMPSQAEPQETP